MAWLAFYVVLGIGAAYVLFALFLMLRMLQGLGFGGRSKTVYLEPTPPSWTTTEELFGAAKGARKIPS